MGADIEVDAGAATARRPDHPEPVGDHHRARWPAAARHRHRRRPGRRRHRRAAPHRRGHGRGRGPQRAARRGRAARQGIGPHRPRGGQPGRRRAPGSRSARTAGSLRAARRARRPSAPTATTASPWPSPSPRLTGVAGTVRIDDPACAAVSYPGVLDGPGDPAADDAATPAPPDRRRVPRSRPVRHPRRAAGRPARLHGRRGPRAGAASARLRQRPAHAHRAGSRDLDGRPALRANAGLSPRLQHRQPRLGRLVRSACRSSRSPRDRRPKPITLARPGHADLAGAIKYDTGDIRDVLERASARSTAPRVAAGAVCRQLLAACGVSHLVVRRPARSRARLRRRGGPGRARAGRLGRRRTGARPPPCAAPTRTRRRP